MTFSNKLTNSKKKIRSCESKLFWLVLNVVDAGYRELFFVCYISSISKIMLGRRLKMCDFHISFRNFFYHRNKIRRHLICVTDRASLKKPGNKYHLSASVSHSSALLRL